MEAKVGGNFGAYSNTVEMSIMHRSVNAQNLCIIRFMRYQNTALLREINVSKLTKN